MSLIIEKSKCMVLGRFGNLDEGGMVIQLSFGIVWKGISTGKCSMRSTYIFSLALSMYWNERLIVEKSKRVVLSRILDLDSVAW